jgi:site-specific DNA-adenine methylase
MQHDLRQHCGNQASSILKVVFVKVNFVRHFLDFLSAFGFCILGLCLALVLRGTVFFVCQSFAPVFSQFLNRISNKVMRYTGSKNRSGQEIAEILQEYIKKYKLKGYIEPFAGSLGVLKHMTGKSGPNNNPIPCYAFDGCQDMIMLWSAVKSGRFKNPNIDEEEWTKLKYSKRSSAKKAFAGFGLSFGGQWFQGYAPKYAKDQTGQSTDAVKYYNDMTYNSLIKTKPLIQDVTFEHRDYKDHPKMIEKGGFLIYCDPPYATSSHIKRFGSTFDYDPEEFWSVAKKWTSYGNVVIVSETTASKTVPVRCIWKKTLQNSINNDHSKQYVDKLFLVL